MKQQLMKAYMYKATCINVVDGDTADFVIDVGFKMTTIQRLRFIGIDTPERGEEGYYEATEFVLHQLLNDECLIQTEKSDVFGRYLATIFIPSFVEDGEIVYTNLNELLIQEGLAKPYKR